MTTQISKAAAPNVVEADPLRPYKAYVATVVAVITFVLSANLSLPHWLEIALSAILIGGSAFLTPNPKRLKKHHR